MSGASASAACVRLAIALCLLLWASCAIAAGPKLKAGAFDPPAQAPELSLIGTDGQPLTLARLRGRVVLLEFGFTACPKVCPTTLQTLANARSQLGAQASRVQVVFVTVDPERDDAQRLRAYLRGFDPTFVGGTGTAAQLAAVREKYGVVAQKRAVGDGYTVGHSSSVYVIDAKGRLRAMMPYGRPASDYVHDLRALLAE